jgi:hypothetical protein
MAPSVPGGQGPEDCGGCRAAGASQRDLKYNRHMLRTAVLLWALFPATLHAEPLRPMMGQYPLPNALGKERFQTGSMRVGHYFSNKNNATGARPDGSGTARNLYQVNAHDAVKSGRAGFIGDVLFLSDADRGRFNLSQWGYLLGMVIRGDGMRLQFDREEQQPLDRGGLSYRYWDVRLGFDFDTGGTGTREARHRTFGTFNKKAKALQRLRGVINVGYFMHNKSYPARTDLTGLAALRYHGRGEITLNGGWLLVGEAQFITEKRGQLSPVSLEASYGLGVRLKDARMTFTREIRQNLDRAGFAPSLLLAFSYPFDTRAK